MKVAIPDSPFCRPIVEHARAVCDAHGWELTVTTEEECGKLLLRNLVQLALVSPLGYGLGVGKVDYRIVVGPCVVMTDFTNMVGINFSHSGDSIETIGSAEPGSYFSAIASIILREKYELPATQVVKLTDNQKVDCVIEYSSAENPSTLDLCEEWYDMTDLALPVAMWASRVEADVEHIADAVRRMADPDVAEIAVSEELTIGSDQFPREGKISYTWSPDIIPALDEVLQTLYFHQYLTEIPAVKMLGIHD
ncbi:MAG: hypothetical protein HQ472_00380 [Ignavibacteria bacterium]|nr:hypothetical protein [Ignavibacteria bacterium]